LSHCGLLAAAFLSSETWSFFVFELIGFGTILVGGCYLPTADLLIVGRRSLD
jgi:hypothetical protein